MARQRSGPSPCLVLLSAGKKYIPGYHGHRLAASSALGKVYAWIALEPGSPWAAFPVPEEKEAGRNGHISGGALPA